MSLDKRVIICVQLALGVSCVALRGAAGCHFTTPAARLASQRGARRGSLEGALDALLLVGSVGLSVCGAEGAAVSPFNGTLLPRGVSCWLVDSALQSTLARPPTVATVPSLFSGAALLLCICLVNICFVCPRLFYVLFVYDVYDVMYCYG